MRKPRPTYANLVSTLALFVALGGTSYAVASLPKNSVGEKQLKKDAVTGEKVKDGSLTSSDLSAGAIAGGPRGPRGTEGAVGPTGATGATGQRGPSDILFKLGGGTALSRKSGTYTATVTLTSVPAGSWLFTATAALVFAGPGADWFRCTLRFGSQDGGTGTVTRLGRGYVDPDPSKNGLLADDGVLGSTTVVQEAFRTTGPTTVALICAHDGDISGTADLPRTDASTLSAVRTDNLQIQ